METMDGYIRVSQVGGRAGESYISPKVQQERIEWWAASNRVRLGEILVEEDVSGGKRASERGLGRLLERCESGETTGIIVYRVNRFSRSVVDTVDAVYRVRQVGVAACAR